MDEFDRARLATLLTGAGVPTPQAGRIAAYGIALLERNLQLNLTGAKSLEALVPHLIDSLTIASLLGGRHIDVGSGGGLPAIPAAIISGASLTMIESRAKKAGFLQEISTVLGIEATVVADRAEDAGHAPGLRGQFSTATARAVGHASMVAELTLPFLRVGGRSILQRGALSAEERTALEDALLVLGGQIIEEREVDRDRRVILIEKLVPTSSRFPRRAGTPAKKPLGSRSFHGKLTGETE